MLFRFFRKKKKPNPLEIIHIGGQGEIGKNMTLLKYGDNVLIIDCGLKFPDDDMPGIDKIYPDISYLVSNKEKVRALILTHAHEDHIGAVPYLLKFLNIPVYGTKLTLGLLEKKLKEYNLPRSTKFKVISPKNKIDINPFIIEPIRVCHSIPDSVAYAIKTPLGIVVHTGDVKIDYFPVDNQHIDLSRFAELGKEGVLVMIADSTNAEEEGTTPSESTVADFFDRYLNYKEGRIIIASFASNIHRIQQVFDFAKKYGKKIVISGMSMESVVKKAKELGYLHFDNSILEKVENVSKIPNNKLIILTTGSQGEPMSALSRMALSEHKQIKIHKSDRVIISASPIPGNEKAINRTINNLCKLGAEVIYEEKHGLHVSGHGSIEDMRLLINILKPKYFIPTHGEYRHLVAHANIAKQCGIKAENIFINENGDRLIITKEKAYKTDSISISNIYVDGSGIGDIKEDVIKERIEMAENGLIVVKILFSRSNSKFLGEPEFETKGFVFPKTSDDLMKKSKDFVKGILIRNAKFNNNKNILSIKDEIERELPKFINNRIERKPVVVAVISQI